MVQVYPYILWRFRFLAYVLMLIPSNVNIPNGFTNICLITNARSFINLTRWVRVRIFQREQFLTFLVMHLIVTWSFWLVNCCYFDKNRSGTSSFCWQYGNYTSINSFTISKKIRCYNLLIFLLLCLWWHYF